jgi:tetratricopeptide (TPR) repeat protein
MVDAKSGPRKEPAKDLEGVFKDFREEVSRENLADAATQHFKLAVTYQDMGMIDDAVKALEVAVRAPRLRFAAASMLAHIFLKRGAPAQAIEWFERAAEAPAPNPEAGRTLLYELADTLESQGETARALAVFMELQADAGDYRDLSARLERLTKVQLRG